MEKPQLSLTDSIKSEHDLRDQYKDSSNLNARAAIYRFRTGSISWPTFVFDQLLSEIDARAVQILELGAGPGGLWRENLARVPQSWRVMLTDLMTGMCDEARATLGHDSRFSFGQMDAQQLAIDDASIDSVVANHMLYHVPDLPRALREIRGVLTNGGGMLIAGTNSEHHMQRMKELAAEFMGEASPIKGEMPFSLDNGERLLRPFFDRIEIRRQRDELRVTDPQAVVRYILSIQGAPNIVKGDQLATLHDRVAKEIASVGAFVIPIEAGIFIAT